MLKEIAPRTERVAVLANPRSSPFDYFLGAARAGAASLALDQEIAHYEGRLNEPV
jgi:hypothetical protein